jgi:hypothetical protein
MEMQHQPLHSKKITASTLALWQYVGQQKADMADMCCLSTSGMHPHGTSSMQSGSH